MNDRYKAKPFLRLLDAYVLDAIGHLPAAVDEALTQREPQFATLFGEKGRWRDIVVRRMNFPAGTAGAIREMWDKGRPRFIAENGREPDPAEFTQIFVDTKFPH